MIIFNETFDHLKYVQLVAGQVNQVEECKIPRKGLAYIARRYGTDVSEQTIGIKGKSIRIWNTPICVEDPETKTWHTIYDTENRAALPGKYTQATYYVNEALRSECLSLRKRILATNHVVPSIAPTPSAPPQISAKRPPRFVAEAIKRDAIATKQTCMISLEEIQKEMKALVTPCFHLFEQEGLQDWLTKSTECPLCKANVLRVDCIDV